MLFNSCCNSNETNRSSCGNCWRSDCGNCRNPQFCIVVRHGNRCCCNNQNRGKKERENNNICGHDCERDRDCCR